RESGRQREDDDHRRSRRDLAKHLDLKFLSALRVSPIAKPPIKNGRSVDLYVKTIANPLTLVTLDYLAPEHTKTGKATTSSFGALLLEVM
ncbi:hypothetical protein U1Q18_044332, partial [Sarracenia purpurea var. burkii]